MRKLLSASLAAMALTMTSPVMASMMKRLSQTDRLISVARINNPSTPIIVVVMERRLYCRWAKAKA